MPRIFSKSMHNCRRNGLDKLNLMASQIKNKHFQISGADNSTTTVNTKDIS